MDSLVSNAVVALRAIEAKVIEESNSRDIALSAAATRVSIADTLRDESVRDAIIARTEASAATASRLALTAAAEESRVAVEVELWAIAAELVEKQRYVKRYVLWC